MPTSTTAVSTHREPELFGQTVVVIGGSAGIGLETARRARAEGASLILTGRNPERLEQAAREVDAQRTAAFDANDPASLQSFFQDLPTPIDQQITEAFPWNEAPCYLVRDRDGIYGAAVTCRLRAMGIRDKPIAPSSPWQNTYAERLIGTIRQECLDYMIVFGVARSTKTRRSIGQLSASALLHPSSSILQNPIFGTHTCRSTPDTPYNQPGTQPADHPVGPPTEHSHPWSVGSPPFSQRTSRVSRGSSGPTRRARSRGCSRTGAS